MVKCTNLLRGLLTATDSPRLRDYAREDVMIPRTKGFQWMVSHYENYEWVEERDGTKKVAMLELCAWKGEGEGKNWRWNVSEKILLIWSSLSSNIGLKWPYLQKQPIMTSFLFLEIGTEIFFEENFEVKQNCEMKLMIKTHPYKQLWT